MARAGRRQIIGFVGNCQAELLQIAFAETAPAGSFTSFYHFFDIAEARSTSSSVDIATCDVLLMQDIQNLEAYPFRDSIPAQTRIIPFPFLRFASPWPYDDFNGLRDGAARSQDDPALHTTTYYDGVLGRLRRTVPEPEARFEAYKNLAGAGFIDPERVHDFETRRLQSVDRRFGLQIGQFVLDEFRRSYLFYTVNRPCGIILAMLLEHLFRQLDLDLKASPTGRLDQLRSIQVPVHPFVARCLAIEWATETRLYQAGERASNWEEFVRGYIDRYG